MTDQEPPRNPLESAVELTVYAPLGFVLEAPNLLPRFVERGRNQVALARVVGKFAVRKGREDVEALLLDRQAQLTELLRAVGVVPPVPSAPVRPSTAAGHSSGTDADSEVADGAESTSGPRRAAAAPRPVATANDSGIATDELAIPGYDTLAASQVVPRLASLEAEELEAIRQYEAGTRGRRTILSKIAQLQSA
ncbi:MAG: hypothetical protein JJU45_04165 [Acidimicrobiia bacterium]|nr:hypothetical protein [Acidimicrobiia bacterium]